MNKLKRLQAWSGAKTRRRTGNVMVLMGAITLGILIAVILFALDYNQFLGASHQHLSAVEAAGLAAAQDLSRIVVKDKNYGFIGLTDYPAIGAGTIAPDGRPLPVTGINTVLGTARLDCLIANKINNPELIALAQNDVRNAHEAAQLLQTCLVNAVTNQSDEAPTGKQSIAGAENNSDPRGAKFYTDLDGNVVTPYADAKRVYMSNLTSMTNGGKYVVNTFELKLGYLNQGGGTVTNVPQPENMGEVQPNQKQGNFYKAFMDIPVSGSANGHFYFAGVSAQPALVDARQCVVPGSGASGDYGNEPRFCSAVKVTAQHQYIKTEGTSQQIFTTIACAEPSASQDSTPAGVLTIAFPDGLVPGINTISDLMDSSKLGGLGNAGPIIGNDWPYEPGSTIGPGGILTGGGNSLTPSANQMFADALFTWIKSGRTKPDIDAVDKLTDYKLKDGLASTGISNIIASGAQAPAFPNFDLMQSAYAGGTSDDKILTGVLSKIDSLGRWSNLKLNNDATKKAYDKIASYSSIDSIVPDNCAKILIDSMGNMYSPTGESISEAELKLFWQKIQETQAAAYVTEAAASLTPLLSGTALQNAQDTIKICTDLIKNQAGYTEDGIVKNSDGTFEIGGTDFHPHTVPGLPGAFGEWGQKDFICFDKNQIKPPKVDTPADRGRVGLLEFNAKGEVVLSSIATNPFNGLPVAHGGEFGVSFDAFPSAPGNIVWTATYRNNAVRWGQGQHGGQPLAGTPVDWCANPEFGFNDSIASTKGKGSQLLGVKVGDYGADKVPTNTNTTYKGSGNSHGCRKQCGRQGKGSSARSATPGTGELEDDLVGYPWGFKSPAQSGQDWSVGDVKWQFPKGNKEVGATLPGNGSGKSLGNLRDWLNGGDCNLTPTPGGNTGEPAGSYASLSDLSGKALTVRANYMCGGMAADFQVRSPFKLIQALSSTTNGLKVSAGGSGGINVLGLNLTLPNLDANISAGASNIGVIGHGDSKPTTPLPDPPMEMN